LPPAHVFQLMFTRGALQQPGTASLAYVFPLVEPDSLAAARASHRSVASQ
jgi:hypothetical protein